MMSGDGFGGKNNAIDQVVTKKLGGTERDTICKRREREVYYTIL